MKNNFIQQQSSRTFKILSFHKIPRPSPVKYKTTFSHASNISKSCQYTTEPVFSREMFALVLFFLYWSEVFSRVNTVTNLGKWRQSQKYANLGLSELNASSGMV